MAFDLATSFGDDIDDHLSPIVINSAKSSSNPPEPASDTRDNVEEKEFLNLPRYQPDPAPFPIVQTRERLKILKNWEGIVTSVEDGSFFAAMRDTESEGERAQDEFEVDIDNVAESDRELVREGSVFYLTVLTRSPKGETPQKSTRIVFRRMPRWSSRDIERVKVAATELWEKLHPKPTAQANKPGSKAQ